MKKPMVNSSGENEVLSNINSGVLLAPEIEQTRTTTGKRKQMNSALATANTDYNYDGYYHIGRIAYWGDNNNNKSQELKNGLMESNITSKNANVCTKIVISILAQLYWEKYYLSLIIRVF